MTKRKPLSMAIAALVGVASASGAFTNVVYAADENVLEEVIVTGSRIKRANLDSGAQMVSLDRQDIDALGSLTVADVLRSSPLNTYGSFNERSGSSAQSNAVIDLRGLGSQRTLVMIDGRRMAGSPNLGASSININMIPMAAIERLDIMADGGSAVYGSDAVAGVVNLQMRSNYEGVELKINFGDRYEDDGTEEGMALIAGVGNDRGNITFVAEYTKRDAIFDRDRVYTAARAADVDGNGRIDAYGADTDGYSIYGQSISIYDPTTGYDNIQAGTRCQSDASYSQTPWLGVTDSTQDWFPSVDMSTYCMYGYANASANKAALDKISSYVNMEYSINDKMELFATGLISIVQSFGRYAPPAAAWRDMPEDYVDVPFDIPALLASGDITEGNYSLTGYYRWTNIGTRDNEVTDTLYDFTLGLRGDMTDTISYEVYAQRSKYDVKDFGYYYLSYPGLDYVLSQGIDPFSPEGAGAMSAVTTNDNFSTLDKIYGHVQVDLGDWLGVGEVLGLVGAEFFEMSYQNLYDRASEAGFVGGSAGNSSGGDRDVTAIFAEAILPVTEDIEINAAIRYDDYSDFGSEVSPSLSAVYHLNGNLTLRTRWSQGFRAPALDELYGPETFSAETAADYYRCGLAGTPPDECATNQIETYFSTNPNLGAETSQTFSIGGNWDISDNWNVDLGYWVVDIEDTISQSTTQSVLYAEAAGIALPVSGGTWVDRAVSRPVVYASYSNAGDLKVEGLDLQVRGMIPTNGFGDFFLNLMWSHSLAYEQGAFFKGPLQETKGFFAQPEDRVQVVFGYTYAAHHLDVVVNYIGDFSQADFIAFSSGGDAFLDTSSDKLDTWTTINVAYTFDAGDFGLIKIGARNVTNEDPVLDNNNTFHRDLYDLYDATGRVYYAEYAYKF